MIVFVTENAEMILDVKALAFEMSERKLAVTEFVEFADWNFDVTVHAELETLEITVNVEQENLAATVN